MTLLLALVSVLHRRVFADTSGKDIFLKLLKWQAHVCTFVRYFIVCRHYVDAIDADGNAVHSAAQRDSLVACVQ